VYGWYLLEMLIQKESLQPFHAPADIKEGNHLLAGLGNISG